MNYRMMGIISAVVFMLVTPTLAGIMMGGQALPKKMNDDLDKSKLVKGEVSVYITATGEKVTLDAEEYLVGVMLSEIPSSYDTECLKSLAVVLRSILVRRLSEREKLVEHFSADFCDDPKHCLGYISVKDASSRWGAESADVYYKTVEQAVYETKGEILFYNQTVADTIYHQSSNKTTESAEELWGIKVPYLAAVDTPECVEVQKYVFTAQDFKLKTESGVPYTQFSDNPENWIEAFEKNKNGRVDYIVLGGRIITGMRVKEIFGLSSACFELKYENGSFIFEVFGVGNGVGLSCEGANAFARSGKSYKEILAHYYVGTKIGLYSAEYFYSC